MRDFNSDILGRLTAETWVNHAEMTVNVVLLDSEANERYYFTFDWGTPTFNAIALASASLARQWSPQ